MNTSSQSNEKDARTLAVAEVIDRRTGRHMGVESWLPCAQEILDRLDAFPPGKNLKDDRLKGGA